MYETVLGQGGLSGDQAGHSEGGADLWLLFSSSNKLGIEHFESLEKVPERAEDDDSENHVPIAEADNDVYENHGGNYNH